MLQRGPADPQGCSNPNPDSDLKPPPHPNPTQVWEIPQRYPNPNPNPNPDQVWEIPEHIQPVKAWDADMTYFSPNEVHP